MCSAQSIHSHFQLPPPALWGLWLLMTVMMGLGLTWDSCREGTGSMSVLVQDRPISDASRSAVNETLIDPGARCCHSTEPIKPAEVIDRRQPLMELLF